MKYAVVLKKSKEGYSVSCPGLPGCWSQGKTEVEALENIQDAIREYLQATRKVTKGSKVREVEVAAGFKIVGQGKHVVPLSPLQRHALQEAVCVPLVLPSLQ